MNHLFKSTTRLFLVCISFFILHSCTYYEEPLSLTTEEFEKTVIGKWKCVRAGDSFSMDKNEEEHIPENREIPIDLNYVDITPDAAIFHFKSPVPLITEDAGNFTTIGSISEITYARSESSLFCDYIFTYREDINGYCLLHYSNIGSVPYPEYINVYGKKDKHADRLIIALSRLSNWDVYFECERM